MQSEKLVLYQYATCPFCHKVLRFMHREGIDLPLKDTRRDPDAHAELIRIGGRSQVPALSINGEMLYESDAIIAWMKTHLLEAQAAQ